MHALQRVPPAAPERGSVTPRLLVVLGVAWAALTLLAGPVGTSEPQVADHLGPRTDALVAPKVVAGPRPVLHSAENPQAGPTFLATPSEPRAVHALQHPSAERAEPRPTLFDRVSYRTTGPPSRNR
ncbi:MAG TPA: hypothetical protein VMN39_06665 [Longimicrobiaceae bacterium]|nr:hypothetical protein [Longimicrobiaceae bacterium]